MEKVLIIHGYQGSPNGGWRPWLMAELEKIDIYACALAMPEPEHPKVGDWVSEISRHIAVDDKICLVGHSLGVPAILRYLESVNDKSQSIAGAVLVSGPLSLVGQSDVDSFLIDRFEFSKIMKTSNQFAVIHGDDDPLVPVSDAYQLSKKLQTKPIIIKGGKHLNGGAGWTQLPEVLDAIKEIL